MGFGRQKTSPFDGGDTLDFYGSIEMTLSEWDKRVAEQLEVELKLIAENNMPAPLDLVRLQQPIPSRPSYDAHLLLKELQEWLTKVVVSSNRDRDTLKLPLSMIDEMRLRRDDDKVSYSAFL